MATISVVISAYNEEKKIGDCLESVKWADEIILSNNSSTDKTAEIAKKHKAKIFKRPNSSMLNINKNFAISKATSDWVLYLDADERVTPELAREIQSVINKKGQEISGFWIPRKNIIFGRWMEYSGMYPDYQMRLFKKGKGKYPEKHVHEMIDADGETAHLNEHITHLNFETISQFIYKHSEIYSINERDIFLKKGYKLSYLDAIRFPVNEFLSRFFAREGYKDGFHGLMLSLFFAFYHFLIFARLWEVQGFKEYNSVNFLGLVSREFKKAAQEVAYWIANEKIKNTKNIVEKYLLKVERKLKS